MLVSIKVILTAGQLRQYRDPLPTGRGTDAVSKVSSTDPSAIIFSLMKHQVSRQ
jgi:hypothetical protein